MRGRLLKKYDAVVIGDANIDLVVVGCHELPAPGEEVFADQMQVHVGGGAALFTLSLAKLGLKLAFNGVLGKDGDGRYILNEFQKHGVDTQYIQLSERNHTGISIALNSDKDRSFITYMGTNQELDLRQLDLRSVELARHVHLTGYRGRSNHDDYMQMAAKLKAMGVTLSCDVGWDDTGEWYEGIYELMKTVDIFFMNEAEAMHYTRCAREADSIAKLRQHSSHFVIKMSSKGAIACIDGQVTRRTGFQVNSVDTTGAGDAFNAGYMFGYLAGKPVEDCLLYGNACGACSVTNYGGSTGITNIDTLEQFIAAASAG